MARGLLAGLERRASPESPDTPLTSASLLALFGAEETDAGVRVTESKALGLTAYYAANRIVSEAIGRLPRKVRERVPGGSIDAPDHWAYELLHDRPNPEMSSFQFWEVMQHHVLTWGNAYAEIQWTADRSQWVSLWPLLPDRTKAFRRNKTKLIETRVTEGGGEKTVILPAERVLHVPGLGFNGLSGYSPIQVARQALGAGLAVDAYAAKFFGQGGSLGGVLQHPKTLSDPALKRLMESSPILQGGLSNAHRWAVLEEGMTANPFRINPEDAQALESRKWTVGEVSRITGVPPHMLADLDRPFQSNVEHMGIQFVMYTLGGWVTRFESIINWHLFPKEERRRFYLEFVLEGLLRGDYKNRMEGHKLRLESGMATRNEVRRLEGDNPIEGPLGDAYVLQQNQVMITAEGEVVPLNLPPAPPPPTPEPPAEPVPERTIAMAGTETRQRIRQSLVPLFAKELGRIVATEAKAVRRALEDTLGDKGRSAFEDWLRQYYGASFETFASDAMSGAVGALFNAIATETVAEATAEPPPEIFASEADRSVREYLDGMAKRHAGYSLYGLLKAAQEAPDDESARSAVLDRLSEWEASRAARIVESETVKGAEAATAFALAIIGQGQTGRTP